MRSPAAAVRDASSRLDLAPVLEHKPDSNGLTDPELEWDNGLEAGLAHVDAPARDGLSGVRGEDAQQDPCRNADVLAAVPRDSPVEQSDREAPRPALIRNHARAP